MKRKRQKLLAVLGWIVLGGVVMAQAPTPGGIGYGRSVASGVPGGVMSGNVEFRDSSMLGSESLTNGALTGGASWTQTADFALAANAATYTHATGAGSFQQTSAAAAIPWASAGINGWFSLTYTTSAVTGTPVCTVPNTFALTAQALTETAGTYTVVFQAMATTVGDFKISCTSAAAATITFDTLSLKQINGGNLTVQGRIGVRSGTVALPTIYNIADPDSGLCFSAGADRPGLCSNSTLALYAIDGLTVLNGGTLTNTGVDAFLSAPAAATWQIGGNNSASPVAQILTAQGCRGGTDSNCAGLGMTLGPTATAGSTGTAIPPPVTINRGITTTTGSTAQAVAPAMRVCGARILSTTSATAQTLATITTTTNSGGSAVLFYTATANDGTIVDVDGGQITVSWDNNAGTVTATASAVYGVANRVTAPDTLAATPTATVATNVVSLKLTPTWTNTTPTSVLGYLTILSNGVDPVVCQ